MISFIERKKTTLTNRIISFVITIAFTVNLVLPPQVFAQSVLNLPNPGTMVTPTDTYMPALINGMTVHTDNPLEFDFIVNPGDSGLSQDAIAPEAKKLIKYFLAGLTVPEKDMWVNLSPYEKDRMVPKMFGDTEMGRDLLAQDYLLKQLTASMMYPEDALGKAFWQRVYQKASEKFGTTDIPLNTFNKIWIVPQEARIYVNGDSAFVLDSKLKVMLQEDYVALQKSMGKQEFGISDLGLSKAQVVSGISSKVVKEVLIPEIEKEVNHGKLFANLRQMYNSIILATWYKNNLQEALLNKVYANKNKTKGVDTQDKQINEKIYQQYLDAFKKGVYNYIREDYDPAKQEIVSRRYFSGGNSFVETKGVEKILTKSVLSRKDKAMAGQKTQGFRITADMVDWSKQNVDTIKTAEKKAFGPDNSMLADIGILAQRITTKQGAQTGEVFLGNAIRKGANGIIAGHSEPRGNFKRESDTKINEQIRAAHEAGLEEIILCIGETETEKNKKRTEQVLEKQIRIGLSGLTPDQVAKTTIAYEPRWAIAGSGKGEPATPEVAERVAKFIRETIANLKVENDKVIGRKIVPKSVLVSSVGNEIAEENIIMYGGAADGNNAYNYLSQPDIDGLLVGGKSTSVEAFKPILDAAVKAGPKKGRIPYIGGNWKTYPIKSEYADFMRLFQQYSPATVQIAIAPQLTDIQELANLAAGEDSAMAQQETSSPQFLEQTDHIPGWADLVNADKIYLSDNAKLYPSTLNFLKYYGGDKQEYSDLRELADVMGTATLAIGETKDPYIDLAPDQRVVTINKNFFLVPAQRVVTINKNFLEFVRKSGRNKILVSLIAGALLKLKDGKNVDPQKITDLEIKIASSKKSLFNEYQSRLDETKALYQIDQKIKNNRTIEGAKNPYFLTDKDITLMISDVLHRGKVLDTRRLRVYLAQLYEHYGEISEERAAQLLEDFYSSHKDIVTKSEIEEKVGIEDLLKKLDDNAKIVVSDQDAEVKETKTTLYGLDSEYIADPAYKERATVWDFEVERQDEVNFGGKSAHTGAMLQVPKIVELPNFFTNGDTFQNLFESNTFDKYRPGLEKRRKELIAFTEIMADKLNGIMPDDLPKEIEDQLNELRVVIEDSENDSVMDQVQKTIQVMNEVIDDIYSGKYSDLKDYFAQTGKMLDEEFASIKKQKAQWQIEMEQVRKELSNIQAAEKELQEKKDLLAKTKVPEDKDKLSAQIEELTKKLPENKDQRISELSSKINGYKTKLADLQFRKEDISAKVADKLLIASRNMVLSDSLIAEIKGKLRQLAQRLNIPLEKLVLAIRSSAVGEDSETASFAGRQDTYIFQRPVATLSDPEGLDALINSWVFNQASLFNKRAIDYRYDQELPTFDDKVEISTLFQTMFLTEFSFIGFSIDRETSFPALSSQWTEGQGELLVSGRESGSKFIMSYDGTLLVRAKGERNFKIVETPDGLGKMKLPLSDKEKAEYALTDHELLRQISEYFMEFHKYYESFVDLEGGIRRLRDQNGNILYYTDPETGEILKDERGFPRPRWGIASTQVRPETVFSGMNLDIVPLRRVVVTEKAYKKAEAEGRVLPFNFISRTGGTAQGPVKWVLDKKPESLAGTSGHIMFTVQSDPDMNTAMIEARGIAAQLGGPNSHTMIVASEYNLIAATGIPKYSLEEIMKLVPEGTEITLDAERGKIILGMDHDLAVEGNDFNIKEDIPDTDFRSIRSSTIVASPAKAFKQWALAKIPSYKGIGLNRLELALTDAIGIYPDDLLKYDNLIAKEKGEDIPEGEALERGYGLDTLRAFVSKKVAIDESVVQDLSAQLYNNDLTREDIIAYLNMRDSEKDSKFKPIGKVLDREKYKNKIERIEKKIIKDSEVIEFVEEKIAGYNSGEDFYVSVLSEWLQATAESLIAPKKEVLLTLQKIHDPQLRLKVWDIIDNFYKVGLGDRESLQKLNDLFDSIHPYGTGIKEGSDADILSKVIGLVDKTLFIRMDDRKSDEYDAVPGAARYVKREVNPMKGFRGLDLMFKNKETLRWQLEAFKKVAESKKIQLGIFAPVVRRPEDLIELKRIMDKYGLTKDLVKRGIMTELPTNSINIEDFLMALDDNGFISTGGNDGLQTLLRVDRNTSNDDLQKAVTAYNISVLRWNANIARAVHEHNKKTGKHIMAGFCGNDPSVHPDYGVILQRLGYDSVSVTIGSFESVANNLTRGDFEIPKEAKDAIGYRYSDFDEGAENYMQEVNYSRIDVGEVRTQHLGVHHKALAEYDAVLKAREKGKEVELTGENLKAYMIVRRLLEQKGYGDQLDNPGVGMKYYVDTIRSDFEKAVKEAKAKGKEIVIGTDEIMSRRYLNMPLGSRYEKKEANPDFGVQGLNKALHGDVAFTKADFEIIKSLADQYGNVDLGLNIVRTHEEIPQVRKIMSDVGLDVPVIVDVEVPGDTFQLDKILTKENNIKAVSVSNPLRLVSDLMNLEQNNINGLPIRYEDIRYQLQRPVKKIATEAKRAGVPFYVDPMISDIFESEEKAISSIKESTGTGATSEESDKALLANSEDEWHQGGINLDPSMLDLKIKRDSNFVPLPMTRFEIENLNIEGFIPVIINVVPVTDLPMLLGFDVDANDNSTPKKADAGKTGSSSFDISQKFRLEDIPSFAG